MYKFVWRAFGRQLGLEELMKLGPDGGISDLMRTDSKEATYTLAPVPSSPGAYRKGRPCGQS
jgi:hypothetical protein